MTLTAGWAANTYVISFNVDGGKALADLNVTYNSAFVLPVPEKENHVFLSWELGGEAFENGIYTKTESITLTAKWDILKFENADVETMKVAYNDSSYVLPIPKREGMTFRYWALNGEKFDGGVLLTKDITLTAEWEGVNNTFDFTVSGSEVTITALHTDLTDIIIPASINGDPVVSIKEGVFANNSSITSVVFDGTFENYTEKMFAGCSSLKSLTISGVFDKAYGGFSETAQVLFPQVLRRYRLL